MAAKAKEMKFLATPEKGQTSALLVRPTNATHLLVLGHGASTNMRHANLQTIAEWLADVGIATLRYNFPYMERGTGRDSQTVCTATVRSAIAAAHKVARDLPLLAGGHSFGGRMTSTAAAEARNSCENHDPQLDSQCCCESTERRDPPGGAFTDRRPVNRLTGAVIC
jgi:alpha/beta superfamily hydrolase